MSGGSTYYGALEGAATRICSDQIRPWAQQVEAKVPSTTSPRRARDRPDTGVQGRAIAARHARFLHLAAATNGSDLAADEAG
jgi:hypothetical protein